MLVGLGRLAALTSPVSSSHPPAGLETFPVILLLSFILILILSSPPETKGALLSLVTCFLRNLLGNVPISLSSCIVLCRVFNISTRSPGLAGISVRKIKLKIVNREVMLTLTSWRIFRSRSDSYLVIKLSGSVPELVDSDLNLEIKMKSFLCSSDKEITSS